MPGQAEEPAINFIHAVDRQANLFPFPQDATLHPPPSLPPPSFTGPHTANGKACGEGEEQGGGGSERDRSKFGAIHDLIERQRKGGRAADRRRESSFIPLTSVFTA